MDLTIDHVPFAWSDLDEVSAEFDRLGLAADYGGAHDNGVTHMSVLGFDDHSYVELIAERREGDHDFWPDHVRADAGPAAWSVRVDDVAAACKRVIDAGHPVRGPLYGARRREDGVLVEWDRAEFGTARTRLVLPFAIADRTPLPYRVAPSESVAAGPLTGVGQVVVAVADLEAVVETFRRLYAVPSPQRERVPGFGLVASFPGQPLALVTPTDENWVSNRLDQFRECPCACLLATDDLDAVRESHPLGTEREWPDGRMAPFDSDLFGVRLGVVER